MASRWEDRISKGLGAECEELCRFGSAKQVAVGPLLAVSHGGWAECCSPSKPVALGVGPQVFGLHPGAETQASCSGSRYVLGEQLLFLPVFFLIFLPSPGPCSSRKPFPCKPLIPDNLQLSTGQI